MSRVGTCLISSCVKVGPRSGHSGLLTQRRFHLSAMWHHNLEHSQSGPKVRSLWSLYIETVPPVCCVTSQPRAVSKWAQGQVTLVYLHRDGSTCLLCDITTTSCVKVGPRSGHSGLHTQRRGSICLLCDNTTTSCVKVGPRSRHSGLHTQRRFHLSAMWHHNLELCQSGPKVRSLWSIYTETVLPVCCVTSQPRAVSKWAQGQVTLVYLHRDGSTCLLCDITT
jgi:hypothetical protein